MPSIVFSFIAGVIINLVAFGILYLIGFFDRETIDQCLTLLVIIFIGSNFPTFPKD